MVKCLILIVALVGVVAAAVQDDTIYPGVPIRNFRFARVDAGGDGETPEPTPPTVVSLTCGTKVGYVCANDCKTRLHCIGKDGPINAIPCSGSTAYCVGSVCQAGAGPLDTCLASNGDASKVTCLLPGFFPNPYDCAKFYFCDTATSTPLHFACPGTNQVYNQKVQACKTRKTSADCILVNSQCASAANANKFVAYAGDDRYFAYCNQQGNYKNILMLYCQEGYQFDATTGSCVISCYVEDEYLADPDNCMGYYECTKVSNKLVAVQSLCPSGMYFDGTAKVCKIGICPAPSVPEEGGV